MFNGAIGKEQLSWLSDVLENASECGQNVVVLCSHLEMNPGAASPVGLMWNYDEVIGCCLALQLHEGLLCWARPLGKCVFSPWSDHCCRVNPCDFIVLTFDVVSEKNSSDFMLSGDVFT
jgi:hypothetical protein